MRRSVVTALAWLCLAPIHAVAIDLPDVPFHANIATDLPIIAGGHFPFAKDSLNFLAPTLWRSSPDAVEIRSRRSVLEVERSHSFSVVGVKAVGAYGGEVTKEITILHDAVIRLVRVPGHTPAVSLGLGDGPLDMEVPRCEVQPFIHHAPGGIGGNEVGENRGLTGLCYGDRIDLKGPLALGFVDVEVNVQYVDDQGDRQFVTLRAGTTEHAHKVVPGVVERTYSTVTLKALGTSVHHVILTGLPVQLSTHHLRVDGALQVPPGVGNLTWADLARSERTYGVDLEGSFRVDSEGDQAVQIQGRTTTRPRMGPAALTSAVDPQTLPLALGTLFALPLAWGLYTRLTQHKVLNHPQRQRIMDLVERNPGIRVKEIVETLGMARQTARYHVQVLARQLLIRIRRAGRTTAVYSMEAPPPDLRALERLRRSLNRRVLGALLVSTSPNQIELAERLAVDQSAVSRALKELRELGLCQVINGAGGRLYALTPAGTALARDLQEATVHQREFCAAPLTPRDPTPYELQGHGA